MVVNFEKAYSQCLNKLLSWYTICGHKSNTFHFETSKFAFITVQQNALDHTKEYWNHQHIRQNFSSESPSGFPSLSYSIPAAGYTRDYVSDISGNLIEEITAKNTVISLDFLLWKSYGKAQFPHSFGQIARNYAETVPFRNISTTGNQVKLRYFSQWMYDIYGRIVSNFGCTNYVELALILTRENSLSYPTNFAEVVNLCLSLINVTSYFQKQPPEVFYKK